MTFPAPSPSPRPVIDCHTHVFPEKIAASALATLSARSHTRLFCDGTGEGLQRSMETWGIHRSLVLPVATSPRQVVKVNDASLAINAHTAETGLLSFGCMHPDFPEPEAELRRIASAGIRGIKLHPVYQQTPVDDPRNVRILSLCGELGLAVSIHAGWDIGLPGEAQALPENLLRAVERAGNHGAIILAHMGGWRCWEEAAALLAGRGLYIDTAFCLGTLSPKGDGHPWREEDLVMMDHEAFLRQVEAFGPDHVLFGTDSPWASQSLEDFLAVPMPGSWREAILWGNARRLLGLEEPSAS